MVVILPGWGRCPDLVLPHWKTVWKEEPQFTVLLGDPVAPRSLFRIFRRTLENGTDSFAVAGIGGVFTPEIHRKKGHALEVLEKGFKVLPIYCVGAILFSKERDLYRRAGFTRMSDLHGGLWGRFNVDVRRNGWRVVPEVHF